MVLGVAGSFYARFGEFDKAATTLQKAEKLNPLNYQARADLGSVLQAQKKLPEAQAALTALTAAAPAPSKEILVTAYATLGSVFTDLKRWSEAQAVLQKGFDLAAESQPSSQKLSWRLRAMS